ncbi:MAG: aminotransferase class IV [Clostridia bacterium]|nr:aminotransferase class IV [Clostridia bacterium]
MDFAYYNGSYLPYDDLTLPLCDRAIFFGDGVYECLVGGGGEIYQWSEHIERLRRGVAFMRMDFSAYGKLLYIVKKLIELTGLQRYTVYLQISRRAERRVHATQDFSRTNLLVTVTELPSFPRSDVSLISRNDIRYKMCNVKTLNLLPSVLASHDALLAGADETVFIRDGIVTECAHSNLFILEQGVLLTHKTDELILPGITRATLIKIAERRGIPTRECSFTLERLIAADEVLITSTTRLARRARSIDGVQLKMKAAATAELLIADLRSDFSEFCC